MQTMKVIAEFGGWYVALDANAIVSIQFGNGQWIYDHDSAYDAIVNEVKDPDTRRELLKQWSVYMGTR